MNQKRLKTKATIKDAYMALLMKSNSLKISVSDICKLAHINRSTFYEYYPYIDQLREDIIKDQLNNVSIKNDVLLDEYHFNNYTSPKEVERYIINFSSNEVLMKLIKSSESPYFKSLIINMSVRNELEKYNIQDKMQRSAIIYRNYGVFATIFGWIEKSIKMSLEDVSAFLYQEIKASSFENQREKI